MPTEYGKPLTERQLEITALVAGGLTNREIAARLYISHNTVKVHLRNIFTKTGVASRTELSMLAMREGWVTISESERELSPIQVTVPDDEELPEVAMNSAIEEEVRWFPAWSRLRWGSLLAGMLLALLILFLPGRRTTTGSGQSAAQALVDIPVTGALEAPVFHDDKWVEIPPLPVRRARFGTAALDGRLYLVGGLTADAPTGRLDVYQISAGRWEEGAARPLALANVQAVVVAGELLVPGGCDAQGEPVATVHRYHPASDLWRETASLPMPLCAYALTVFEGQAYLLGGWDGQHYRALNYRYDPVAESWTEQPSPVEARGFGSAATLGTRIFYVGGYDGDERATCEVYQPEEERWGSCASLLQPRGGLGLAALGGSLYAVGGGWNGYLGFNERYQPQLDTWSAVSSPLVGEWRNLGVTTWESTLYALGGWSGDYLNRTYALEVLPFKVFIPVTLP
ncbi:MAG: LuxR C-terminal-related transcriptional regulator [Chloroflexota bacterium]|nr:LuxR C-terminal-related transcriptional regulator [Chloroflexota bacterium]